MTTPKRAWRPFWLDINCVWTIALLLGTSWLLLRLADDNLADCGP